MNINNINMHWIKATFKTMSFMIAIIVLSACSNETAGKDSENVSVGLPAKRIDMAEALEIAKGMVPPSQIGEIVWLDEARLYQVELLEAEHFIYISETGQNIILGIHYQQEGHQFVNKTLEVVMERRNVLVDEITGLDDSDYLAIYKAKNERARIYVFTDTYCPYCRRFHESVPELNKQGITVKYFAFPILREDSMDIAVSIWCSEDREKAMNDVKSGKTLKDIRCPSPIGKHLKWAQGLRLRGTPGILFENNEMASGALTVEQILETLELKSL